MNIIKNIISYISSFIIPLMSSFIWNFNSFVLACEKKIDEMYNSNGVFRKTSDSYTEFKKRVTTYFDYSLKEPDLTRWTGFYHIHKNNQLKAIFNTNPCENLEDFHALNTGYNSNLLLIERKNACIISRFDDYYRVYHSEYRNNGELKQSNNQFLSVFYNHPQLSDSIQINIPDGMIIVGNELFNKAFVLRSLKTINPKIIFDDNYTIHVMDMNINEHIIRYNQYLHIDEDDFSVKLI